MLSEHELLDAIEQLEKSAVTYQSCEKLATFYILYDHLYGEPTVVNAPIKETTVGNYGKSEFLQAVRGRDAAGVWAVIDELMQTISLLDSKLYGSVIQRIDMVEGQ